MPTPTLDVQLAAALQAVGVDIKSLFANTRLSGTATVTLPPKAGVLEWTETVAAAGIIPANQIMAFLAACPDSDENDPEMLDLATLSAEAGTDSIIFTLTFSSRTSGPIKLLWKVL